MRIHKIRAAVQVAVDWAFGFASAKAALNALDKACSHSELSGVTPIASAIRLLVFYADVGAKDLDSTGQAERLEQLKEGVKRLAGLILGLVAPSQVDEEAIPSSQAPDFKRLAAGDVND